VVVKNSTLRNSVLLVVLLTLIAHLLVLVSPIIELRVIGAVVLLFIIPGPCFTAVILPLNRWIPLSERLVLSIGSSAALSVILLWILYLLPPRLTVNLILSAYDITIVGLIAIAVWLARYHQAKSSSRSNSIALYSDFQFIVALAAIVCVDLILVLPRLNFGDLLGDELQVAEPVVDILLGNKAMLFSVSKGPAQLLLVMGIARLSDSLSEWIMRLPFALCAVIAAGAFALLARLRFSLTITALVTVLMISQGMLLNLARWTQYQMFVLAMIHLALYCGLRGWVTRRSSLSTRYWILAAIFGGAGLLGHYDGALIAPALLFLFIRTQHSQAISFRSMRRAIGLALIALVISVPFYVMYSQQALGFGRIESNYVGLRLNIGNAPFNHFGDFFLDIWDFESAYRAVVVFGLILIAILAALVRKRFHPLWLPALISICVIGVFLSALQGTLFRVGRLDFAFVPFVMICIVLAWQVVRDPFWMAVLLWIFTAFGFTGFVVALPYSHYYAGLPALLLVAGQGMSECAAFFRHHFTVRRRKLITTTVVTLTILWLGVVMTYAYLEDVLYYPALLYSHPERNIPWFSQLASTRFQAQAYTVSAAGWRAVAVLYELGDLRGENSTSLESVRDWYLFKAWTPPTPSERYFIAAPAQKTYLPVQAPPADFAEAYSLWGTILVDGDPQIKIFQRTDGQPLNARTLNAEDYEAEWQRMATVTLIETFKAEHRSDPAFLSVSHLLQSDERAGDAIVVEGQPAKFVLNQYFTGQMPDAHPASASALENFRRIWGVFWANDSRKGELELASNEFPLSAQWVENIRVRTYAVAPAPTLSRNGARLGDAIQLVNVSNLPVALHPGDVLPLQLQWRADPGVPEHYKVFVHVTDSRGAPFAQSDSEPVADLRPTTTWTPGETIDDRVGILLPNTIAPGHYSVVAGMYALSDGVRLPARSPDGSRYPNDAVPIGVIDIIPN
jgi:hypothetical protein